MVARSGPWPAGRLLVPAPGCCGRTWLGEMRGVLAFVLAIIAAVPAAAPSSPGAACDLALTASGCTVRGRKTCWGCVAQHAAAGLRRAGCNDSALEENRLFLDGFCSTLTSGHRLGSSSFSSRSRSIL